MKKVLFAFLSMPFILASCKEKGPAINFGTVIAKDTTYIGTVESPQQRSVLIEEFTGIKCSNCPEGHKLIADLETKYRIIPVALHMNNNPLASNHPEISPVDFRTEAATTIDHDIYSTQTSLPFAGADRTPYNNNRVISSGLWESAVQARLAAAPPMNITIGSTYDAVSRVSVVKVTVKYTSDISKKQKLSLMLVEDSIDAPQDYIDAGFSKTYNHYTHNHILHNMYTAATGDAVVDSIATKRAGRVYERTFIVDLSKQDWKPEHCKIIAFISNNEADDREVLQAAETALKP